VIRNARHGTRATDGTGSSVKLRGRLVVLSPVRSDDAAFVHELAAIAQRRAPYVPQIAEFGAFSEWSIATFLIRAHASGAPIGLIRAVGPNFRDRLLSAELVTHPMADTALVGDATSVFLRYVFDAWDFRKVYAYASRFPIDLLPPRVARAFVCEGVLRQQYIHEGIAVDERIFAAYRRFVYALDGSRSTSGRDDRATRGAGEALDG
jgi:hypothetical protein